MAARQQTGGGAPQPPFGFGDGGAGAFDFGALQNVLNDPNIKAMAEKLAQDPAFAQMTQSLQSGIPGFGGAGPAAADQAAAGGSAGPNVAHEAMQNMFQNQDFVNMAQELGQKIMQSDPGMQGMMQAMQQPAFQDNMNERLQKMKDDPQIAKIMKDVEAKGPQAMMSYWSDPQVMERMNELMGDVLKVEDEDDDEEANAEEGADEPEPPLHEAATNGKTDELSQLLKEGADVDERDAEGRTALHFACGYGELECAEVLIDAKASINVGDGNDNTALHYAAGYNQEAAIKLLLKHDADKAKKNSDGKTPREVAEINGASEVAKLLQG